MSFLEILSLIGSVVMIVLILFLTFYASRWYAKRMGAGPGKYIKIVDRAVLGQGSAVFIIKVQDSYYLLGTAEKGLNMLGGLPDFKETGGAEALNPIPFERIVKDMMKKTGLRGDKGDNGEG